MDDQTTWKGHTFTLLVFTGIVVLSSIFFILGMLVGRAQGQKLASTPSGAVLKADAKSAPKDDDTPFTFYDDVKKDQPPAVLQSVPAKPAPQPVPVSPPKKAEPLRAASGNTVYYQISALKKGSDAEKLLKELRKKGFRALIVAPPPSEPNPLFRVQVGPFAEPEAQDVKKKLESGGYRPILKK